MAEITALITDSEYRLCTVDGKKALFHRWELYSKVVGASALVGGSSAGQVSYTLGIVEYEDGTIDRVFAERIKFCDGKVIEEWNTSANTLTENGKQ